MVAFILLLGLIIWGVVTLVKKVREFDEEAQYKAEQRRIVEVEKDNFARYGWRPKEEMFSSSDQIDSLDWNIEEDSPKWKWFIKNSFINATYLKTIAIRNFGTEVYLVTNYYRAEWYVEKLWIDEKERYEDFSEWSLCWKSKGSISKKFTSKKKAIEAIDTGDIWFDNDLTHLEEVKAAAGTGEFLHVKYWGGTRGGKPRYLTVLEVSCLEGGDEEGGDTWYAEVRERGARKDKTYRIDRMQLLPVNPADLIEDA